MTIDWYTDTEQNIKDNPVASQQWKCVKYSTLNTELKSSVHFMLSCFGLNW